MYDHNEKAPWDVGHPQQDMVEYICRNDIHSGRCLEIGCGTGDLSIYLAERGCNVLGIDDVAEPIEIAKRKAGGRNLSVDFTLRDAFHLEDCRNLFDYVFDVGFLHNLKDGYRTAGKRSALPEFVWMRKQALLAAGRKNRPF